MVQVFSAWEQVCRLGDVPEGDDEREEQFFQARQAVLQAREALVKGTRELAKSVCAVAVETERATRSADARRYVAHRAKLVARVERDFAFQTVFFVCKSWRQFVSEQRAARATRMKAADALGKMRGELALMALAFHGFVQIRATAQAETSQRHLDDVVNLLSPLRAHAEQSSEQVHISALRGCLEDARFERQAWEAKLESSQRVLDELTAKLFVADSDFAPLWERLTSNGSTHMNDTPRRSCEAANAGTERCHGEMHVDKQTECGVMDLMQGYVDHQRQPQAPPAAARPGLGNADTMKAPTLHCLAPSWTVEDVSLDLDGTMGESPVRSSLAQTPWSLSPTARSLSSRTTSSQKRKDPRDAQPSLARQKAQLQHTVSFGFSTAAADSQDLAHPTGARTAVPDVQERAPIASCRQWDEQGGAVVSARSGTAFVRHGRYSMYHICENLPGKTPRALERQKIAECRPALP